MAFLCPVRIRRGKKTKEDGDKLASRAPSIGRITGSASVETLVRVGIEKENGLAPDSKMVVLHDFTPCVDDELEVKRGQVVNVLYQENDWVYVIADNNAEGFIPHSYCASIGSQLADLALNINKKKIPRGGISLSEGDMSHRDGDSLSAASTTEAHPFYKNPSGRFIVLYTFIARDENDVSAERGEFVTVLNKEDPDWYWIIRSDGQEGFVPSAFVCSVDVVQNETKNQSLELASTSASESAASNQFICTTSQSHLQNRSNSAIHANNNNIGEIESIPAINNNCQEMSDARFHGTELVMLYDYKAQASDDLNVRRGDWIYANLSQQTIEGWLWAYAPKSRKYGFIPKAYARPPAMTSL